MKMGKKFMHGFLHESFGQGESQNDKNAREKQVLEKHKQGPYEK